MSRKIFLSTNALFMRPTRLYKNILQKGIDKSVTLDYTDYNATQVAENQKYIKSNKPIGKRKVPVPGNMDKRDYIYKEGARMDKISMKDWLSLLEELTYIIDASSETGENDTAERYIKLRRKAMEMDVTY